jgi:signal transduction histidine kinase
VPEPFDPAVFGELLGLLAHDLRNPLSALHSNLGFLGSVVSESDADAREAVADGLVSCDGLAHIIDNIDLVGQTMRAGDRPEGVPFDVGALVTDVVSAARSMAQSHNVEIDLAAPPAERVTAHGARDLVARALANLLRNSIQHSPSGATVRVSFDADSKQVVVRVEDRGTALSGAVRTSAFTAMGQVGSKSVPHGRYSRGLGLYCAALAAAAARAAVRAVEPPQGQGNAFELVLSRH